MKATLQEIQLSKRKEDSLTTVYGDLYLAIWKTDKTNKLFQIKVFLTNINDYPFKPKEKWDFSKQDIDRFVELNGVPLLTVQEAVITEE